MHYFARNMKALINKYGADKAIEILNECLSDEDGSTLKVWDVDTKICDRIYEKKKRCT